MNADKFRSITLANADYASFRRATDTSLPVIPVDVVWAVMYRVERELTAECPDAVMFVACLLDRVREASLPVLPVDAVRAAVDRVGRDVAAEFPNDPDVVAYVEDMFARVKGELGI
jgi:hypothetical protein